MLSTHYHELPTVLTERIAQFLAGSSEFMKQNQEVSYLPFYPLNHFEHENLFVPVFESIVWSLC